MFLGRCQLQLQETLSRPEIKSTVRITQFGIRYSGAGDSNVSKREAKPVT